MKKFSELEEIENLIRAGHQIQARSKLLQIDPAEVSSVDLVYFCSLLRRVRMSVEVIKILQPLIYPKARSVVVATAEEKLEYASNLIRLGALSEASKILDSVDANRFPIVLIRKGFLSISNWDYQTANTSFQQYIDHPQAELYNVFVAQVNLLQGLVYLREVDQAWDLAQELLQSLDPVQNRFLLGAVYEFCAEIFRQKKNQKKALEFIQKGKVLFADSNSTDEFLLRKQEQIVLGDTEGLQKIKDEAIKRKHYESIRDIDFHLALIQRNEKLLNQVYWGTKSPFYKDRVFFYAQEYQIPVRQKLFSFKKGKKGIVFDLQSHFLRGANLQLKSQRAEARLLKALLVESYNPVKIFDLFAAVYPEEVFFPKYSVDKVHQLLKRLRRFIALANLPLEIVCRNEEYRIVVLGEFSLTEGMAFKSAWEEKLKQVFKNKYFNVAEAQHLWESSLRTTLRRIDQLKKQGRIQVTGKTRATKFRFV